ncbi:hypothetical protein G3578_13205 [Brevibacillus sp. SYP-B805]|uniref:hypothetical protein n=1 Tax=Brevibacillus sp. SYP-B805 TaxID=1578199 RepID=UPI0013EDD6A4|nr:hypothetical protein [Brevibacillus sp. SYP-B805]NGQ96117.1 hypothetical protein [Brevibacillus sp. SYP-B805]
MQGYKKHFGVDLLCAIKELQMLGVSLDANYVKQVKQSVEGQRKAREKRKKEYNGEEWLWEYPDSDETFSFLFTDG